MRVFIATISTETNTFSTMPTALTGFKDYYLRYGTATSDPANLMTEALHLWRERVEALGGDVIESLAAIAEPAGLTTMAAFAHLKSTLLDDLAKAGAVDLVLLQLHGAMVAEGVEDCEGDILAAVRIVCPEATIGVSLDLHCHLTDAMVRAADVMLTFKEYPHDDATPRAAEVFNLTLAAHQGRIKPVMEVQDCQMIGLFLTKTGAMERLVRDMEAAEAAPGILSVSLGHGFPWADVADVGTRVLVIADGDRDLAKRTARQFGQRVFAERSQICTRYLDLDTALDLAEVAARTPVVLADMGDNSGAGAAGDATIVLEAILKRGIGNIALGLIWDPLAVRIACDAGKGSKVQLRVGGKVGPLSGNPLDIHATVTCIKHGIGQHLGPGLEPMGTVVCLTLDRNIDILINDLRVQVYHPEAFEQLGIDVASKRLIVVKSTFHFYAPFAAIAPTILQVATRGGSNPDLSKLVYTKRRDPIWRGD